MKINEKNLSAYSTSTSPVDKEGWLCKRGELNKGYQKRWFVLKGNLLFYFDRKSDKEPLGVVILEGCSIGAYWPVLVRFMLLVLTWPIRIENTLHFRTGRE